MTAKIPAKRAEKYGSLSTKQKDHHKGDPDARQAVAIGVAVTQASPTSAAERSNGMTEPDPSTTPPVRTGNRVSRCGDLVGGGGKTPNAQLAERLDMYFGGTSWAIGAFCAMHGHELNAADLRDAVEQQLDQLKEDVLSAVSLYVYPPANAEAVK